MSNLTDTDIDSFYIVLKSRWKCYMFKCVEYLWKYRISASAFHYFILFYILFMNGDITMKVIVYINDGPQIEKSANEKCLRFVA